MCLRFREFIWILVDKNFFLVAWYWFRDFGFLFIVVLQRSFKWNIRDFFKHNLNRFIVPAFFTWIIILEWLFIINNMLHRSWDKTTEDVDSSLIKIFTIAGYFAVDFPDSTAYFVDSKLQDRNKILQIQTSTLCINN